MSSNKILFATDFSHTGDAALEMASSLARDRDATLLIVHVEEPPLDYGGEMYYGMLEPDPEEVERMLHQVVPKQPGVKYEHRLVTGDPAAAIVRVARDENVDLIVLGTHGRTGVLRLLMGSVTESVVRHAPCPVLTLKQPHKQEVPVE
jgi:nucleotide-binding universal stress UspA family protein